MPPDEPAALPEPPTLPACSEKDKVLEMLYDMHADPNADRKEMARLLDLYRNMTGKDKPLFMA